MAWLDNWFLAKTFTDEDIVVSAIEDLLKSEDVNS
jgi:hypothetical protein